MLDPLSRPSFSQFLVFPFAKLPKFFYILSPGVGVLVISVLVFTVFCIVCTVFWFVSFMYIYSHLFCLY